jgi:hypothetical protein
MAAIGASMAKGEGTVKIEVGRYLKSASGGFEVASGYRKMNKI